MHTKNKECDWQDVVRSVQCKKTSTVKNLLTDKYAGLGARPSLSDLRDDRLHACHFDIRQSEKSVENGRRTNNTLCDFNGRDEIVFAVSRCSERQVVGYCLISKRLKVCRESDAATPPIASRLVSSLSAKSN